MDRPARKVLAMRDEFLKIARARSRHLRSAARYGGRYADDLYRALQKARERRRRELEKKSDLGASGPGGFLQQPYAYAPQSKLDPEGRMRTNDEPDAPPVIRAVKGKIRSKPMKKDTRRPFGMLTTSEDPQSGDYPGAEPRGTGRQFHANHENFTVG